MSLALRAGVSATATDDGTVLLDERSGHYWQLNQSGSVALRSLLAGDTPAQVAQNIADIYAVPLARVIADLHDLLNGLNAAGLVTS